MDGLSWETLVTTPTSSSHLEQNNLSSWLNETTSLNAWNTTSGQPEYDLLYEPPIGIITLLSILYGGISIIAVIGNSLVIWIVATTRQMHTVTNMYIANLASADVIIGIFCIPFQFQAALLQTWNLPEFMCAFCPFVQVISVNVSVFTLTAIAVDRHRAIINPLRARPTKFISKIIIVSIWAAAISFAIPIAIALRVELLTETIRRNNVTFNYTRPFCENKNLSDDQLLTYRYYLVFVQYVVPFCVISFVYIQMAIKLWGSRTPGNAQDSRDITLLRNKKKVIKMLIIVVSVFGLCWLPLQLYNILYVTLEGINEYRFIPIVWFFCDWLAMSNSCYNPFIYGIYNEKFKREFTRRFAFCCFGVEHHHHDNDKTISVYTRASSIRSTFAHGSTRNRNSILQRNMVPSAVAGENGYTTVLTMDNPHSHAHPKKATTITNNNRHSGSSLKGGIVTASWNRGSTLSSNKHYPCHASHEGFDDKWQQAQKQAPSRADTVVCNCSARDFQNHWEKEKQNLSEQDFGESKNMLNFSVDTLDPPLGKCCCQQDAAKADGITLDCEVNDDNDDIQVNGFSVQQHHKNGNNRHHSESSSSFGEELMELNVNRNTKDQDVELSDYCVIDKNYSTSTGLSRRRDGGSAESSLVGGTSGVGNTVTFNDS